MKKTRSEDAAASTRKLNQEIQEEQESFEEQTPNLSPKRITEGAVTTTKVLDAILAQAEHSHQLRHWGINE